jgi:histidinol-phosphate aminotransferase
MAFASEEIISYLNKVKYPYNINMLTQQFVYEQLDYIDRKNDWVKVILEQRELLVEKLRELPFVETIYPSDANFLLVRVPDPENIYNQLVQKGIIVRKRNNLSLCGGCLRITVGTLEENNLLINELKQL